MKVLTIELPLETEKEKKKKKKKWRIFGCVTKMHLNRWVLELGEFSPPRVVHLVGGVLGI